MVESGENEEEEEDSGECVTNIDSTQLLEEILDFHKDSGTLILLEIYADWCRKCKFMLPKFEKECELHPQVLFLRMNESVDVDYVKKTLGTRGLPCFMLFRNKQRIDMFYANNQDDLEEQIQDNL